MSTSLGLIDVGSICYAVYLTYKQGGVASDRYASSLIFVLLLSFVGIILGLIGKAESEKFYFFAYLGMVLNILAVCMISGVLYAGAYGL